MSKSLRLMPMRSLSNASAVSDFGVMTTDGGEGDEPLLPPSIDRSKHKKRNTRLKLMSNRYTFAALRKSAPDELFDQESNRPNTIRMARLKTLQRRLTMAHNMQSLPVDSSMTTRLNPGQRLPPVHDTQVSATDWDDLTRDEPEIAQTVMSESVRQDQPPTFQQSLPRRGNCSRQNIVHA